MTAMIVAIGMTSFAQKNKTVIDENGKEIKLKNEQPQSPNLLHLGLISVALILGFIFGKKSCNESAAPRKPIQALQWRLRSVRLRQNCLP